MEKPREERKYLELDNDEIMDSKAFIWACGRNTDGELALTDKTKSASLPRHVR